MRQRAVQTLKRLGTSSSLQLRKFFVYGFRFFVSDVISGVLLGLFGPLHTALGPNR